MQGNFSYQNPTKLYFGENALKFLSDELQQYGPTVQLCYGGGSIKRNGIYDAVRCIRRPSSVFYFYFLDDFRWNAANNRIWFYVFSDHSTCCYNGSIADGHARKYSGIGSYPDVLADVDGSIRHALTLGRVQVMVDSGQHNVMTDECALVDGDAALVLKLAPHVDEHPLTNDGVLAAVGMERWEHTYRLGYLSAPKLFQQYVQFFRRMILTIDFCRYL